MEPVIPSSRVGSALSALSRYPQRFEPLRCSGRGGLDRGDFPERAVVFILDANDDIDITSAEQLAKLTDNLHAKDVAVGLAHVHGPALQMAQRSGLLDKIGPDHIFQATPAAVAWAQSAVGAPAADSSPPPADP